MKIDDIESGMVQTDHRLKFLSFHFDAPITYTYTVLIRAGSSLDLVAQHLRDLADKMQADHEKENNHSWLRGDAEYIKSYTPLRPRTQAVTEK